MKTKSTSQFNSIQFGNVKEQEDVILNKLIETQVTFNK